MKKNLKPIPRFKNEAEERRFWERRDSTQYVDWSKAKPTRFPNLKPSTQSISLRLPASLLDDIKIEANKRDVPYQSLIKVWLAEKTGELSESARRKPRSVKAR
jgi:predicted DNA binding CopG/RHH family protein